MGFHRIRAYTQNYRADSFEARHSITEIARLDRAAWSVILWVEVENDLFSPKFREGYRLPLIGLKREVRRNGTPFDHLFIILHWFIELCLSVAWPCMFQLTCGSGLRFDEATLPSATIIAESLT